MNGALYLKAPMDYQETLWCSANGHMAYMSLEQMALKHGIFNILTGGTFVPVGPFACPSSEEKSVLLPK